MEEILDISESFQQIIIVGITNSLLYANCKDNLLTEACLYLLLLPWQQHIRQLTYQKTKVCINLFAAIFGDQRIKGFGEKGE